MAYEAICFKHIYKIKKGLGIHRVRTEESTWRYVPRKGQKEKGSQIDLLIDRTDRCINVCEIKFHSGEFSIDKVYANELQQKLDVFSKKTNTKKTLFLTMITAYKIKENEYSQRLVQKSLTMDVLFD